MISWIQLWPLLVIPYGVLFGIGLLPDVTFMGQPWGGALVREWLLNQILLPLLPSAQGWDLVAWYQQASITGELLLHALITLNLYVFFGFPLFLALGTVVIRINAWSRATDLIQKRRYVKR